MDGPTDRAGGRRSGLAPRRSLISVAAVACAVSLWGCSQGAGGALGPTHRPVDPYAQAANVPSGNASTASFAAAHAGGPAVPVGRWVRVRCLSVPERDRGTFELYALYVAPGGLLVDATPLVRVDSPWPGWTSRFPVPARAHLRDADETGIAPRLAWVHYARGDRNRISGLTWSGTTHQGAGASFALEQESEER